MMEGGREGERMREGGRKKENDGGMRERERRKDEGERNNGIQLGADAFLYSMCSVLLQISIVSPCTLAEWHASDRHTAGRCRGSYCSSARPMRIAALLNLQLKKR